MSLGVHPRPGFKYRHRSSKPSWPPVALYLILSALVYWLSKSLFDLYVYGDVFFYQSFYNRLLGATFGEIAGIQRRATGSAEPLYGILMWVGVNVGIDRSTLLSLVNILFIVPLIILLKRYKAPLITILLALSNYYILVLLIPAERQKLALTCILLALVVRNKFRIAFFLAAPLFHFTALLYYASMFMAFVYNELTIRGRGSNRLFSIIFLGTLFVGLIVINFQETIMRKLVGYSSRASLDLVDMSALLFTGLYLTRKRWRFLFMMAPMLAGIVVLGGEARMNMLSFLLLSYVLITEGRAAHPLFLLALAYFSYKNIGFVQNIVTYGTGWPGSL